MQVLLVEDDAGSRRRWPSCWATPAPPSSARPDRDDTDLDGLVCQLSDQATEGGVRVFTIAYGKDADVDTLKRISEASRAAEYDATDPLTIETVFTNVLSNF